MKHLIEQIASYKNAVQSLIDKTDEYEAFIKKEVPTELWKHFSLGRVHSNVYDDWHIKIDGKLIPSFTKQLSTEIYWNGDFNAFYKYVSGTELISWSKELPKLIKKAEEYIKQLTIEAEKSLIP